MKDAGGDVLTANNSELTKAGNLFEKLEYIAINAMLSTLDPHSIIIEPKNYREIDLTVKGEFGNAKYLYTVIFSAKSLSVLLTTFLVIVKDSAVSPGNE